ncbi:MAG: TerB family tellurite resistance protein [Robiginitalea sp.]
MKEPFRELKKIPKDEQIISPEVEYNLAEKLGILKAIDQVIRADGRIYEGEAIFISQLSSVVPFDADLFKKAREIKMEQAVAILKAMPGDKKEALARLLNEAANADGRVGEDELRAIYQIFTRIGINFDSLE